MIKLVTIAMVLAGLWTGFCHSAGLEWMGPAYWFGYVSIGSLWGFVATIAALLD